jgi:hypothetical protein
MSSYQKTNRLEPYSSSIAQAGIRKPKETSRVRLKPAAASRTVRYAQNRLKDEKILVERHYFIDARQSLYGLNRPVGEVMAT